MYYFTAFPSGGYSAPNNIEGGSTSDRTDLIHSDERVIYGIYDALASVHQGYVTKQTLGKVFSRDINRYTFTPFSLENKTEYKAKQLKIAIITSIHGYEQGCAFTTAQFFRLLCENRTDPHLSFLRRNVTFDVIPVANPSGFAYNRRKNANGVDLNRNFEPGFIYDQPINAWGYGGPSPASEAETRILMQFIEENSDAVAVLDYHNIAEGYPLFYAYGQDDVQLAQSVFSYLTDKWTKEYSELPRDRLLGLVKPNGKKGMFADYILSKNLWGLTLETPWMMPEIGKAQYDSVTIRCALDVLVNTLLAIVQNK